MLSKDNIFAFRCEKITEDSGWDVAAASPMIRSEATGWLGGEERRIISSLREYILYNIYLLLLLEEDIYYIIYIFQQPAKPERY